jgi:hypothetical protein
VTRHEYTALKNFRPAFSVRNFANGGVSVTADIIYKYEFFIWVKYLCYGLNLIYKTMTSYDTEHFATA